MSDSAEDGRGGWTKQEAREPGIKRGAGTDAGYLFGTPKAMNADNREKGTSRLKTMVLGA